MSFALTPVLALCLAAGQADAPLFRAGARLVEVTVTVLDKKGDAVTGLAPEDFTVLDEGKSRPIAFFHYEGALAAVEPPRTAPGVFTNRVELIGGPPRSITALVLDALNTEPRDGEAARAQMMRYLRALAPTSRVALFLMGVELRILHDFTDAAASLRARLEKAEFAKPAQSVSDVARTAQDARLFLSIPRDPALQALMAEFLNKNVVAEMQANSAARANFREQSLAALEALGRHLGGIPGRKNLVWVSAGFSMVLVSDTMSRERIEARVRDTARRLAQQGVTLYIVNPRGVESPFWTAADYRLPQSPLGRFDPREAMNLLASVTGGRYLYNTNDLAAGFKQAVADLRGSYTLGFYAPEEPDSNWHKLKVQVGRAGANVRHREGYASDAPPPKSTEWNAETWQVVMSNPLGSSVIPLTATCTTTPAGELALALTIDAAGLDFRPEGEKLTAELQVAVADRTAGGIARSHSGTLEASVAASQLDPARAKGLLFERQWKPAADVISIRVVVRDARTGQYGTVDLPLSRIPPGVRKP